jgi:hypothetical protein
MAMSSEGSEAKNDCAAEDQLQSTKNQMLVVKVVGQKYMVMGSAEPETKNGCAVKSSSKLADQKKKS